MLTVSFALIFFGIAGMIIGIREIREARRAEREEA